MIATRFVIAVAAVLWATAATAQTHSEMLERAIFAEETAGDLDGAIRIYEKLLSAPAVPREIAARAQSHLSDGRRRREQAATAAAIAAQQSSLPRGLREAMPQAQPEAAGLALAQVTDGCCGLFSGNYDPGGHVAIIGTIARIEWVNPQTVLYVDAADGNRWAFTVSTPNTMIRNGWNRNSPRIGEQVVVTGYRAKGTGECPAPLPNACATFPGGALHASASSMSVDGKTIFDRPLVEQEEQRRQEEQERARAAAGR